MLCVQHLCVNTGWAGSVLWLYISTILFITRFMCLLWLLSLDKVHWFPLLQIYNGK